jgi:hypothetical protein
VGSWSTGIAGPGCSPPGDPEAAIADRSIGASREDRPGLLVLAREGVRSGLERAHLVVGPLRAGGMTTGT